MEEKTSELAWGAAAKPGPLLSMAKFIRRRTPGD
jgi:hypothetical protein